MSNKLLELWLFDNYVAQEGGNTHTHTHTYTLFN